MSSHSSTRVLTGRLVSFLRTEEKVPESEAADIELSKEEQKELKEQESIHCKIHDPVDRCEYCGICICRAPIQCGKPIKEILNPSINVQDFDDQLEDN